MTSSVAYQSSPAVAGLPAGAVAPTTAAACFGALLATAVIVSVGDFTARHVALALARWLTGVDPALTRFSGPLLVGIYQFALLWMLARWLAGDAVRSVFGLIWPRLKVWHWVAVVVGLYALKALASLAALWVTTALTGSPFGTGVSGGGGSAATAAGLGQFVAVMKSSAWPLLLAGGILAAIVEELLYRGYLSRVLENSRLGFWGGALVASIVWAGLHLYYPLGMQVVLVVIGLALSWLRVRTGSVLPGMAWHIVNNAIGLLAMRMIA